MNGVAVVGLDCVFPGAAGPGAYWDLLMRGGCAIGDMPPSRRGAGGFRGDVRGGFLTDADVFDNDFFSVTPREAAAMDPQQRLLLQCAWRAVEDCGRAPGSLAGSDTGVFIGTMSSEWAQLHMSDHARVTPQLGAGSSTGMTANRISYHFDLRGPSLAVDTACSSSLVAVHLAVNSLLSGECGTALAGGVNLVLTPALGQVYAQMGLAAPDGRCKPFSMHADGIGRSEGAGLVVLRRLEDALADGQRIYAVIRGTAVNQDGRSNGVTAPSRWAQRDVVAAAHRRAGVDAAQIRFVEAHGTGTALGDVIECAALGEVHGIPRETPCALGSVKGNLGHTEGAAGIAGLIKVALSLHHRTVPASLHATDVNPQLRLAERGMSLLATPLRLPAGEHFGSLSSFGMGGTNAHAVLSSAPRSPRRSASRGRRDRLRAAVFTVSADTPAGLQRNLAAQAESAARMPRTGAGTLCFSSNRIKSGLPYRAAFTVHDTTELAAELGAAAQDDPLRAAIAERAWLPPTIGFLYPGQGAQEAGTTAGLYRESDLYRRHLDEADEALRPHLGASVRDLMLEGDPRINRTGWAQPALFAVGHALTRTLGALGVTPDAVLGHSVGEFAAAVAADALTLEEAARLVAVRARLMDQLPDGGGMLTIRAGQEHVSELLAPEPEAVIAALNGPTDTVISGSRAALERIAGHLRERGIDVRPVSVSHAFHSPLMAPALSRFPAQAGDVTARPSRIPFASTRHGRMLTDDELLTTEYFCHQAAEPVLFSQALQALVRHTAPTCLIELGPRPQLLPLAARSGLPDSLSLLHPSPGKAAAGRELAETLAALYRLGLEPDWDQWYTPEERTAHKLPPYLFAPTHHVWRQPAGTSDTPAPTTGHPPAACSEAAPAGTAAPGSPTSEPSSSRESMAEGPQNPVLTAVLEAVVEVGEFVPGRVGPRSRFYEDLAFDSVMIMQLKDRIEVRLPQAGSVSIQQLLPALSTVSTLADFLHDWTSAGAST